MSLVADARPSGRGARSPTPTEGEPAQPSLRRMRRFEVRPDRELGQSFLIDSNILGVIERAAELDGERDVVLEIGGGLGVLSEYLAQRVRHVHVVEIDTRLREALLDATDPHPNVSVHWGDAMRIDLAGLSPAPGKVVANLPYGIAAGVLLRTIEELPDVGDVGRDGSARGGRAAGRGARRRRVRRQLGDRPARLRRAGAARDPAHGVLSRSRTSTRCWSACAAGGRRPRPRCARWWAARSRTGARRSRAHSRSWAGAVARGRSEPVRRRRARGGLVGGRSREEIRLLLSDLGQPENVRAERLSPEDFRELGRLLEI